jgi:hypothetical protein
MKPLIGALITACALVACGGTKVDEKTENAGGDAQAGSNTTGSSGAGNGGNSGTSTAGADANGGDTFEQPIAQGAVIFSVKPSSPQPTGKACPTSAFTADIPAILSSMPAERLDEDNYIHKVVDGEDGVSFSCRVAQQDGWVFEGDVQLGGRGLRLANGSLSEDGTGTAEVTIIDSQFLSPSLLASNEPCMVTAMQSTGNNFQVRAGSMWAKFTCAAVEALPSSSCAADGIFVLENCAQD